MKKSYLWLSVLFWSCISCRQEFPPNSVNRKPNVIIINVDDLGYGDISCNGATLVHTPNIDKLAEEGLFLTDFHAVSAVCSPSRYALMTGEYPARKDFYGAIFLRTPSMMDTAQMTIAKVMKRAGYTTAAIGKWHLGLGTNQPVNWNEELNPGPLEFGFDYYFGVPVLNSHPPFVYVENHWVVGLTPEDPLVYDQKAETRWFPEKFGMSEIGGGRVAHQKYDDRMVGTKLKNKAIEWIEENKEAPFFLYFATTNIHHPFTPAPRFIGTSEAGRYGDFIHELDWMVGEIMSTLEDSGLEKNTLIILTSDNGGMLNQGGQEAYDYGHRQNGKLLGFKFDAWEGGHRVPFIARWPGKIPSGTKSSMLAGNIDFIATMADLVGYKLKEGEGQDSYSFLPELLGKEQNNRREYLIICPNQPKNIAIRKGDWMYISGQGGGGFEDSRKGAHAFGGPAAMTFTGQSNSDVIDGKLKADAPLVQLYNLQSDPYQSINVYDQNKEIAHDLHQLIESTLKRKIGMNKK